MADKIIAAKLSVDTGNSSANIKEVNKNLVDVKSNLKETGSAAKSTGKDVEGAGGSFSNLKDKISALPGSLGQAGEGVKGLSSTFKGLLANPIVLLIAAIVAGLALLYKAFANTFAGGEKIEQVFAGIKAVGQSLLDNLGKIASAFIKFVTLDFSGAVNEIKGVAAAAGEAYTQMAALTKEAQQLARDQADNDLDQVKRQKRLAELREQSTDETVPLKKRKEALLELKKDSEQNAKDDLLLAKKVADNRIAQLTLEKDGYKKNYAEIQKIKAEQIQGETDNFNELRRIGKQITAADRQEATERKEAAQKANEEAKKRRQEYADYSLKLQKLQQENGLAIVKDAYQKELRQLEIKIGDEKRANAKAFNDGKLSKEQQLNLNREIDIKFNNEKAEIDRKHNEDIAKKEQEFQKDLAKITQDTRVKSIKDSREVERVQLQIGYEEKLNDAIVRYKDDQVKFQQIKNALDEQLKAEQEKLEEKNRKEDAKKKFDLEEQKLKDVIDKKGVNPDFEAKKASLDAEQILFQEAFDAKTITELEYNKKVEDLANKRKEIADLETAHKKAQVTEISGTLSALADLVGKQTIAGKALGIATALINTYQGASEAIKQKSTLPSPFDVIAKVAAVATVIATGLKTVKAITAVQVPGGGGGGGVSAPSITAAAPVAPTVGTTSLDQASLNQINNATTRAFVLDSDVQNNRETNTRLNRAARLSG